MSRRNLTRKLLAPLCAILFTQSAITGCSSSSLVSIEGRACSYFSHFWPKRFVNRDKLDLLLVINNAPGKADKTQALSRTIPSLIGNLSKLHVSGKNSFSDIHVAVITSSLGDNGTENRCPMEAQNDHARLLPRTDTFVSTDGKRITGFKLSVDGLSVLSQQDCPKIKPRDVISWTKETGNSSTFYGASGFEQLQVASSCTVLSAENFGCEISQPLEAMYRFLIDPRPAKYVDTKCAPDAQLGRRCKAFSVPTEVDAEIIKQREAFLRPDSLVAVVVLSDENDFSLNPAGENWAPWAIKEQGMFRGWAGCQNVPDSFEDNDFGTLKKDYNCNSCAFESTDPNCTKAWEKSPTLNRDIDHINLRGFNQLQRFGYNFLHPTSRYVKGLRDAVVPASVGEGNSFEGQNPLFKSGLRGPELVIFAAIVGVPNQLVGATEGGKYVAKEKLLDSDWEKIIGPYKLKSDGTIDNAETKRDVHMIESIAPRNGIAKFSGGAPITTAGVYNGGDRDILDGGDLQYACISNRAINNASSDCSDATTAAKNPLCDVSGASPKQPRFKAYPGTRFARVAQGLGDSGFLASICNEDYSPAIKGIQKKLEAALNSQCQQNKLTAQDDGRVNCLVVESMATTTLDGQASCEAAGKGYCTPGKAPCRVEGSSFPPISLEEAQATFNQALSIVITKEDGSISTEKASVEIKDGNLYAFGASDKNGTRHLLCEMQQITGDSGNKCRTDLAYTPSKSEIGGWCYTENTKVVTDDCRKKGAPGLIRYLGNTEPRNGSELFTACLSSNSCG